MRWRCRISVANLSREEPTIASVANTSACRSRWITWVDAGAGVSPSFPQTCSSTKGSMLAKVPTAPEILPTEMTSRARFRRTMSRRTSSAHSAIFHPNVTGSAWMPCVRPIITVPRCSIARRLRTSKTPSASWISSVRACRIWTANEVSSTSELVIPTWRKRESSPMCSATEVRKAMTSCFTFFSISSIRPMSKAAFRRTRARASFGISPLRTIASIARISMSSQIRNRFSSCQMAAISGRVYRSITSSPSPSRVSETARPARRAVELRQRPRGAPTAPARTRSGRSGRPAGRGTALPPGSPGSPGPPPGSPRRSCRGCSGTSRRGGSPGRCGAGPAPPPPAAATAPPPWGSAALPIGGMTTSASTAALRSIPAAPSVWYAGRSSSPPRSSETRTSQSRPRLKSPAPFRKVPHGGQREPVPAQHFRGQVAHLRRRHRVDAREDLLGRLHAVEEHLVHREVRHAVHRALERQEGVPLDQLLGEGHVVVGDPPVPEDSTMSPATSRTSSTCSFPVPA